MLWFHPPQIMLLFWWCRGCDDVPWWWWCCPLELLPGVRVTELLLPVSTSAAMCPPSACHRRFLLTTAYFPWTVSCMYVCVEVWCDVKMFHPWPRSSCLPVESYLFDSCCPLKNNWFAVMINWLAMRTYHNYISAFTHTD
jgi:hypothetical protein